MKSKDALEKLDHTLCLNSLSLKFDIDNEEHIDCKDVDEMVDCVETIGKDLEVLEILKPFAKAIIELKGQNINVLDFNISDSLKTKIKEWLDGK